MISLPFYVTLLLQNIATAALFLAAKVEEQPRKLEYVAKISYMTLNKDVLPDASSEVILICLVNLMRRIIL